MGVKKLVQEGDVEGEPFKKITRSLFLLFILLLLFLPG